MDVHKPKPIHGWREFVTEIGIIVIGVLIALSAEQVVETIHWQHKMRELRAAMVNELTADGAPEAYFRLATHDCLERYLDNLQDVAEAGGDRVTVAGLAGTYPGYVPALLTWDMEAWRSFVAADGTAHMPTDEIVKWTMPYLAIPPLQHYPEDEREAMGALQSIQPAPGRMSPAELEALARALQRIRTDNDWIQNYSTFLLGSLRRSGLKLDARALDGLYHSQTMTRFQRSLEVAHLSGCTVKPDLANLQLRAAPSMPETTAAKPR
ncbi:MAG: hypothetical protein ACJ798_00880 [Phenylobacterium sp.]